MTKKKRLLLVGFGDIPQRLLQQMNPGQWQCTALRRSPFQHPDVDSLQGDARDAGHLKRALASEPDQVLVTLSPDNYSPEGYRNAYLKPVENLVQQLDSLQLGPRVTFVSSSSVYAQNNGQWVDEKSPAVGSSQTSQVLCLAEQCLLESATPTTIVRFSGIYGPGRERLLARVQAGEFSSASRWTNRIHSEDCAGVLNFLLEAQQKLAVKQVLLCSDRLPVSSNEVECWLAGKLGVPGPERLAVPTLGKRCNSAALVELGYRFRYPDFRAGYEALLGAGAGL